MIQQASAVQVRWTAMWTTETSNGWVVWVPIDGQHEIHCVGPSRQRWSHTRLASPYASDGGILGVGGIDLCLMNEYIVLRAQSVYMRVHDLGVKATPRDTYGSL